MVGLIVALTFESQNLTHFERDGDDSITLNSIAVSVRGDAGRASPYVALVVPIEEDVSELLSFAVTAGLDLRL